MAHTTPEGVYSLPAAADLTNTRYQFVQQNSSAQLALCAAGGKPIGIQDGVGLQGEQVRYWKMAGRGALKVKANATMAQGTKIASDANGMAVAATTGQLYVGTLFEDAVPGRIVRFDPESGTA